MRSIRLLVLAASLAASITAIPAYADSGPGGGVGGAAAAAPAASFRPFRMAGALFSVGTPAAFTGAMQYTLLPTGQVRLVVAYFNTARLPAGTALDVMADGVKVGTLVTSAQGGFVILNAGLPRLTLQSRISLAAAAKPIASGAFTLKI